MNKTAQIFDFLAFIVKSTNQHGIHSPYLFDFYNQVIDDTRDFYVFEKLENLRRSLLMNEESLEIIELGAGSSYGNAKQKKISDIAKQQLSSAYQLRVLYRVIDWVQSRSKAESLNIIELGSSLGLSTLYLASASQKNIVHSFEGNPYFVKFVEGLAKQHNYNNIAMIEGNFDETLPSFLSTCSPIDIGFIDGNHREEATVRYFEECLEKVHNESILVFDDIHWSKGMKNAWNTIISHERVSASIDMYFMGIIFFRNDFKEERNLKIRPIKFQ